MTAVFWMKLWEDWHALLFCAAKCRSDHFFMTYYGKHTMECKFQSIIYCKNEEAKCLGSTTEMQKELRLMV